MIPRIDTRMYTNLILTVIAFVLVAGAAREIGVDFTGKAQAQTGRNTVPDLKNTATGVLIDESIPQMQDVAVASATSEVAVANREIAAAIRELATAVRDGADSIKSGMAGSSSASSSASAPVRTAPAAPTERPTIEVAR